MFRVYVYDGGFREVTYYPRFYRSQEEAETWARGELPAARKLGYWRYLAIRDEKTQENVSYID